MAGKVEQEGVISLQRRGYLFQFRQDCFSGCGFHPGHDMDVVVVTDGLVPQCISHVLGVFRGERQGLEVGVSVMVDADQQSYSTAFVGIVDRGAIGNAHVACDASQGKRTDQSG